MSEKFDFDRDKFKALILYFAREAKDDPCFGSTVLNKMLFAAEFLAYRLQGKPIAGATYIHRQFGPAPKEYVPIREELIREESLRVDDVPFMGKPQKKPVALRGPDLSSFTKEELEICSYVVKFFTGVKAAHAVDWSHTFPGYLLTGEDEDIPYHTA